MPQKTISPFQNESEVLQINGLTVENRLDRVSVYGSIDFTLDKIGLEKARNLFALMKATVEEMEAKDLPETVVLEKTENMQNPFK